MKENIASCSKIFDSKIRIQILASLSTSSLTYTELRKICMCADGAMTNHTKKLHEEGFIDVKKEFVDNKPLTTYSITEKGMSEFREFVQRLNQSIEENYDEKNEISSYSNAVFK